MEQGRPRQLPVPGTVGAAGEFGLIGAVVARLPQGEGVLLGPGDDAALVAAPDGRVVASTDLLVEGRHFRRDWSSARDVGRKAAAQNLADIAAMGAAPTALLVGLALPSGLPAAWPLELADGLREECSPLGASVVGGDVVGGEAVVVAVTALGSLAGRPPVTRSGARAGDVVAVCGRLGWSAAGLAVLLAEEAGRGPVALGRPDREALLAAHRRPTPPYAAGPGAALLGATALCDVSDGLAADLGHVAAGSGVAVRVDPGAVGVDPPVAAAARALGADPLTWVLTGGEDHALAACFPPGTRLPGKWRVVGEVSRGTGVRAGGYEESGGFDHFR